MISLQLSGSALAGSTAGDNLACVLIMKLRDAEGALEVLRPFFERVDRPAHI